MCARSDLMFQTPAGKSLPNDITPHYFTMFSNHHGLHMALINDHITALVAEPIKLVLEILKG